MPKKTDAKVLLRQQIEKLEKSLSEDQALLAVYTSRVRTQEEELARLVAALGALEGTLAPLQVPQNEILVGGAPLKYKPFSDAFPVPQAEQPKTVKVNGEDVVLEPGFHVERNSFGEDCIVPDGVTHAPAAEPKATPDTSARFAAQPAVPLPALTSGTGFEQSPEEMIFDELPIKGRE